MGVNNRFLEIKIVNFIPISFKIAIYTEKLTHINDWVSSKFKNLKLKGKN